jgi:hypothetical protein
MELLLRSWSNINDCRLIKSVLFVIAESWADALTESPIAVALELDMDIIITECITMEDRSTIEALWA